MSIDYTKIQPEGLTKKSAKDFVAILIPTLVPSYIANAREAPGLCLFGTLLSFRLLQITMNPSKSESCTRTRDKEKEKRALRNVTITSITNRLTRISMGGCFLLSAVLYKRRSCDGHNHIVSTVLIYLMCVAGVIWGVTGANGQ